MIGADMVIGRMADGAPQASGLRLACHVTPCAGLLDLCCLLGFQNLKSTELELPASHIEPHCYEDQVQQCMCVCR
jgi:hypothetical protein